MATLKHINSKNADYGAAEQYLLFEHDEFTMKPVLDETGRLIPREDYRLSTLNCGGEDFAVACMRANLRYQKNQRREDVEGLSDVSSPVELGKYYSDCGADELVFYDITASAEGRALFTDILTEVAQNIFIPLTVGGGINTLADFDRVLKCGADKVSVNSGAIRNPELIREAAQKYGNQCVVLSVDVKRVDGKFMVFAKGGRENTGMEALPWIARCVEMGAGEVVVNSIDTDGVKQGFDLELLKEVCALVNVPVIASGGAGCIEDFVTLFREIPDIDAGLAASIFHFGEVEISALKERLAAEGIIVRR